MLFFLVILKEPDKPVILFLRLEFKIDPILIYDNSSACLQLFYNLVTSTTDNFSKLQKRQVNNTRQY